MNLKVIITDSLGTKNIFYYRMVATRTPQNLPVLQNLPLANQNDWIGKTGYGALFSKFSLVNRYASSVGDPDYFQPAETTPNGMAVRLFSPGSRNPFRVVLVPNGLQIAEVIRVDANLDGKLDWVFTSAHYNDKNEPVFQFLFLDEDLRPLYGDASVWQRRIDFGIVRSYSTPGSWIKFNDQ